MLVRDSLLHLLCNLFLKKYSNSAFNTAHVGQGGGGEQEINEIDETAAIRLICLVIILTPQGPHFRASIVVML